MHDFCTAQAATCVEWNWTRSGRMITTRTGDFQPHRNICIRQPSGWTSWWWHQRQRLQVHCATETQSGRTCHKHVAIIIAYPCPSVLLGSKLMRLERGSIGWRDAEVWYAFLGRKHLPEAEGGTINCFKHPFLGTFEEVTPKKIR